MKYRKHALTAVFCALLLFYGGDWLLERALKGPLEKRRARTALLNKHITVRERQLAYARAAGRQLLVWQSQSLPGDPQVARSLYRAWLLELAYHAGLSGYSVDSGEPLSRKSSYYLLPFILRGRGNLEQLTKFLFEFYTVGYLHKIGSIGITPSPSGDQLDLSLSIEAVALPSADKNRLPSGLSGRLASSNLEDYQLIVARNLFAGGGSLDAVEHTYLDAVVSVGGRPQAWFGLRASGEKLELHEGESFSIGMFTAKVVEIAVEDRDVVIESAGGRWLLSLGENLTEAFALPPEF